MIAELLEQSVRGSLAVSVVWLLDRWLATRMKAGARRVWWLLAALAFLLPWKISLLPAATVKYFDAVHAAIFTPLTTGSATVNSVTTVSVPWVMIVWFSGAGIYLVWLVTQTLIARHKWSRERLSTDSRLLELLEDCKRVSGVTAPIGLVLTDKVATPALMGWLRPRILLPSALAETLTARQLSAVLLHELAHFKWLDIPTGWLLATVQALHWFNPFAWFMVSGWKNFRETAADEAALAWSEDANGELYGETILKILRFENQAQAAIPFGSLAIGESMQNLKTRMIMIKNYRKKSACYGMAGLLAAALMAIAVVVPARAESEQDKVVKSMVTWLEKIDDGKYAESWKDSSALFQAKVTESQWEQTMQGTRPGLGKCVSRKLKSAMPMKDIPSGGEILKGDWLVVIFDSSFENLKEAKETVSFQKDANGEWKCGGYFIQPR